MLQLCLDSQISHKILEAEIRQNTSLFLRSPWSQVTRRLHHWSQDTIHTLFHFSSSAKMAMVATIALSTSICLDQEHITWSDQNISKDLLDLSTLPPSLSFNFHLSSLTFASSPGLATEKEAGSALTSKMQLMQLQSGRTLTCSDPPGQVAKVMQ